MIASPVKQTKDTTSAMSGLGIFIWSQFEYEFRHRMFEVSPHHLHQLDSCRSEDVPDSLASGAFHRCAIHGREHSHVAVGLHHVDVSIRAVHASITVAARRLELTYLVHIGVQEYRIRP